MIFGFSILVTAILLSCVAAYYSVAGLTAIFSAAAIPVMIMGGSLELGKIVATVWLHNNWQRVGVLFKVYLVPAVAFLMLLTSMGIFGYLSKAHSDQSLVSGDAVAKVAIYDEKIKISRDNIEADRRALKQMDEAVDQVMGRSADEKGADKAVAIRRGQQRERARILADIETEQKKITGLNEERAPLAAEFRKVESEVGPIKYIAALVYGDNPDSNVLERAVRLVIIMIVLVFDPLALTLILAANKQFEWARAGTGGFVHDQPRYEPDDGPLTQDQIEQIKASVPEPPDDPIPCYKCGTPLVDAPGIGLFCPNKECDVIDNVNGEEPVEFITPVKYQFIDEHPYAGITYYRIKQIDNDRKFNYSGIVSVEMNKAGFDAITIFPNPVQFALQLKVQSSTTTNAQLSIYNLEGRLIKNRVIKLNKGINPITISDCKLDKGIYYTSLLLNGHLINKSFIVK